MGCNTCKKETPTHPNRLLINDPRIGKREIAQHPLAALKTPTNGPYLAKIEPDGSIIYDERDLPVPPDINGYERDPDYPWLFHEKWPTCTWRLYGLKKHEKLGIINVLAICQHKESVKKGQRLSYADCEKCPLLSKI